MSASKAEHSDPVVDRRRYLDSDQFEARMTAHVRSATRAAAEEYQRHLPPRRSIRDLISTWMKVLQRHLHAR
jgi:hypothetical protein